MQHHGLRNIRKPHESCIRGLRTTCLGQEHRRFFFHISWYYSGGPNGRVRAIRPVVGDTNASEIRVRCEQTARSRTCSHSLVKTTGYDGIPRRFGHATASFTCSDEWTSCSCLRSFLQATSLICGKCISPHQHLFLWPRSRQDLPVEYLLDTCPPYPGQSCNRKIGYVIRLVGSLMCVMRSDDASEHGREASFLTQRSR